MAETNDTLKKERIAETNNAANTDSSKRTVGENVGELKTESQNQAQVSEPKNKTIRMIGYPVVIGSLGLIGGIALSNKLNKSKTWFVVGGVIIGASAGFLLYKNWEKRNK